ncbi:hypothetical protein [Actinomyces vulturis]|uniref:hypothetical protein n=1 Tax=Actinomyces vulturis TaxID=1857645 RepID=UPI00083113C3|nr:hypothetical protein [Actinomyces vulturis]
MSTQSDFSVNFFLATAVDGVFFHSRLTGDTAPTKNDDRAVIDEWSEKHFTGHVRCMSNDNEYVRSFIQYIIHEAHGPWFKKLADELWTRLNEE